MIKAVLMIVPNVVHWQIINQFANNTCLRDIEILKKDQRMKKKTKWFFELDEVTHR